MATKISLREEIEGMLFWFERFPTIFVTLVYFFGPDLSETLILLYLTSIPILAFTNYMYFWFHTAEDAPSNHGCRKQYSLPEELDSAAFLIERIGAAMLVIFGCYLCFITHDALRISMAFITAASPFTMANFIYLWAAICRMLDINSPVRILQTDEPKKGRKKEVTSEKKTFGLLENLMDANGGENTLKAKIDQVPTDTNLDKIQKLKKTDMFKCSEVKMDNHHRSSAADLVEVEDSQAYNIEAVETAEDSEGMNTNSRETIEDNFEMLNTQRDEYTKKLVEAMVESYWNKLKKKKKNWEKQLKHVAEKYEKKWENERQNLASQLSATTTKYEFYHTLHCNHEENRLKWEDEKNDLITKLSFATASSELYKTLLHDLFNNSE